MVNLAYQSKLYYTQVACYNQYTEKLIKLIIIGCEDKKYWQLVFNKLDEKKFKLDITLLEKW